MAIVKDSQPRSYSAKKQPSMSLLDKGELYQNLLIAGGIFKKKDYVSKQIKYTFHNFHLDDAAY